MTLLETNVTSTSIHMRYADHQELAKATRWAEFLVPIAELSDPRSNRDSPAVPLGAVDARSLAIIHLASLRYMRDVIGEEIRRFSDLAYPS